MAGSYAYVTSAVDNSLIIVDVSSPTSPTVVTALQSPLLETPIGIVVDGRYAYTTNLTGTGRMSVFDIGGTTVQTLHAGEVRTGTFKAAQEAIVGNNLTVGGSLGVGRGGFLSNGPGAFNSYAPDSLATVPTLSINLTDDNDSSIVDVLSLSHAATASSDDNIGTGLLFAAEDASGIAIPTGRIASILTETSTSPRSDLSFSTKRTSGALTEAMRISDEGFVGIGTSDPIALLHVVNATTAVPRGIVIGQHEGTPNSAMLTFRKSLGSHGSPAAVTSGTNIANVLAEAYDGSQYISGGRLRFRVDGTVSANSVPTAVQLFSGTGNGGGTERLTIASGAGGAANETNFNDPGNDWNFRVETDTDAHALFVDGASNSVGIGDSDPIEGKLTVGGTLYVLDNSGAGGDEPLCWDGSGGSLHGACTSSERYKTDIADYTRGLDDILKLAPRSFSWKRNADGTLATSAWATTTPGVGFIAEEVAAVNPDLARVREDGAGDVNERALLAAAVNAIQELAARVTELEDRIQTLEAENAELEAHLDASEKH